MTLQYVRPVSEQEIADGNYAAASRMVDPQTTVVRLETHKNTSAPEKQIVVVAKRPVGSSLTVLGAGETFSLQFESKMNSLDTASKRLNVPKQLTVMGKDDNDDPLATVLKPSIINFVAADNNLVATMVDDKGSNMYLNNISGDLMTSSGATGAPSLVNTSNVRTAAVNGVYTLGVDFAEVEGDLETFEAAFRADIAAMLGVSVSQVVVYSVSAGSCVVEFTVLFDSDSIGAGNDLDTVAGDAQTTLGTGPADLSAAFATVIADSLGGDANLLDEATSNFVAEPVQIVEAVIEADQTEE